MSKKIIKEKYEANIHLYTLLDVLQSLQENGRKYWYSDDIDESINDLIKKIENQLYPDHEEDDISDEKMFCEVTYEINEKD